MDSRTGGRSINKFIKRKKVLRPFGVFVEIFYNKGNSLSVIFQDCLGKSIGQDRNPVNGVKVGALAQDTIQGPVLRGRHGELA